MNHMRYWRRLVVLAAVLCSCAVVAAAGGDDLLADFDFEASDDEASADRLLSAFDNEQKYTSQPEFELTTERALDTLNAITGSVATMAVGIPNAFAAKENTIRVGLQRATQERGFRRTFAQVLPILRSLNAQQRLVLASLISAQAGTAPGKGLNLKQVEKMFGERRNLILPLLFDIANVIKSAAAGADRSARAAIDKNVQPIAEFLQSTGALLGEITGNSRTGTAQLQELPAPVASDLRDDRLQVDDTDDVLTTRNLVQVTAGGEQPRQHSMQERSVFAATPPPTTTTASRVTSRSRQKDQRSYHERKFNMTAFSSGSTPDQQAMESEGVPIQITLPRSPMSARLTEAQQSQTQPQQSQSQQQLLQPQLTLEQYEEMAFRDLNDTASPESTMTAIAPPEPERMVRNETTGELLPLPEMLISRYRNKNNPYRKQLAAGTNGIEASASTASLVAPSARQCDRFGSLCLRVEDYPMQAIMGSIRRHKHAMSALLAEYIDKDDVESTKALNEDAKRREDDELTPSGMCPSVIRYARPQKARSATGEWKYIVNTGQHTQTLRLEKCTKVEEPCTYLTDNFRSRCVQVFNYHRLLSWDNARGLHIDIFKVPTCCSCHIDSYKEKFPPIISSYNGLQDDYRFSASNIQSQQQHHTVPSYHHQQHTSPYSTILSGDEPQLDDAATAGSDIDDESIAYQFSNGFKRSPGKNNKYRDSSSSGSANKPLRYDKPRKSAPAVSISQSFAPVSPTLDSYLTPPTSDSEFDFVGPFKRGGTAGTAFVGGTGDPIDIGSVSLAAGVNRRNRRPVRTNNRDQIIAGSDFLPEHSSVIHPIASNTAYASAAAEPSAAAGVSPSGKRQSSATHATTTAAASSSGTVPGVAGGVASTSFGGQPPRPHHTTAGRQHQHLPSISTASTSAVDLGKRVNYNYHPIIDFFGDAMKSEKEIDDRVGSVVGGGGDMTRTWRPMNGAGPTNGAMRRRPLGR